ncbi:unnamed protein product [Adineta steineri]|uniref:Uncharacterized protein n=2 Tax=Adineta steineri TaxID=433720 RepID=A0A815JYW5_9BILA|nr:unnamed protein product [Adineta steineri]
MKIISEIDDKDTTNVSLPILFEISIKLYNLIKNYPNLYQNSRIDELVELAFQRYRPILKFSNHLPEKPKAENLTLIYTPKKQKQKKRPTINEQPPANKRQCVEPSPSSSSQDFLGLASFISNDSVIINE